VCSSIGFWTSLLCNPTYFYVFKVADRNKMLYKIQSLIQRSLKEHSWWDWREQNSTVLMVDCRYCLFNLKHLDMILGRCIELYRDACLKEPNLVRSIFYHYVWVLQYQGGIIYTTKSEKVDPLKFLLLFIINDKWTKSDKVMLNTC